MEDTGHQVLHLMMMKQMMMMMMTSLYSYMNSIFYFFFGFTTAIYCLIVWHKWRSHNQHNATVVNDATTSKIVPCKLYLNMFFLDREEFVRNIIRSKVSRSKPLIRALAKRAAVALLSNHIVEKVATGLCNDMPGKLERLGIEASANIIYTKGAYVCIEVSLNKVDVARMIEFNAGPAQSKVVTDLLAQYSFPMLDRLINRLLLLFFMNKLINMLPTQIKNKLQDKDADVEVIACTEEEIGTYLTQTLVQLNAAQKSS